MTPIERVREALEIACGYTALVADGNTNVPIRKERAADDCRIIGEALSELDGHVLVKDWQPIESAPRDGTEILTFCEGQVPEIVSMKFISGDDYALWIFTDEALSDICPEPEQPTYWMPMIAPYVEGE